MADAPKLLERIRMATRTRHYSIRTEEAYVAWAKRFILFHGKKHPSAMGAEEINQFLTHLAVERNVAASTRGQALSALLFLYREYRGASRQWAWQYVFPARRVSCDPRSGEIRRHDFDERLVQSAFAAAMRVSGVQKARGCIR